MAFLAVEELGQTTHPAVFRLIVIHSLTSASTPFVIPQSRLFNGAASPSGLVLPPNHSIYPRRYYKHQKPSRMMRMKPIQTTKWRTACFQCAAAKAKCSGRLGNPGSKCDRYVVVYLAASLAEHKALAA
jgi:hypothetical protein